MFLYLDESGDLGYDPEKQCSEKFVITVLLCLNDTARREFNKAVRRTIKNKVNKNKQKQNTLELKGTRTRLGVKKYFLKNVKSNDWKLFSLIIAKRRMRENLKTSQGKKKLYNFLSRVLIGEVVPALLAAAGKVELIIDKSKNSGEIKEFNHYLENHLEALLPLNVPLNIYHLHSVQTYELQAVDLFSWGIFRKYESNDLEWYNCFSYKIDREIEYLN